MARTPGRRSGGQQGRRRDEEYGREDAARTPTDNRQQDTDNLIADMAKGFVEAQAKIAATPASGSNREMMDLLEKISRQLAQMQASPAADRGQDGQRQQTGASQGESGGQPQSGGQHQAGGQQGKGGQAELSAIFSRLLSAEKQDNAVQQQGNAQSGGQGQDGPNPQGGGKQGQSGSQQQGGQSSGSQSITAQTAAQALAQAQYELANELEASLSKLKQVISESEKLADRISNLLGQEGGSRQT